jgi:hypothetical protein
VPNKKCALRAVIGFFFSMKHLHCSLARKGCPKSDTRALVKKKAGTAIPALITLIRTIDFMVGNWLNWKLVFFFR